MNKVIGTLLCVVYIPPISISSIPYLYYYIVKGRIYEVTD
jgi:hypothetical protein